MEIRSYRCGTSISGHKGLRPIEKVVVNDGPRNLTPGLRGQLFDPIKASIRPPFNDINI